MDENDIEGNKRFSEFIRNMSGSVKGFWCLCGDYNIVLYKEDRVYG